MKRLLLLSTLCVCLALPAVAAEQAPPQKAFNAETFTLDNGLQVVVIPNRRAPVVTSMVWYKVGAIDEEAGYTGIAHFLEHLMFKGTQSIPAGEFSRRVRAMGGEDNAFTTQDYTAFYETVAVEKLPTVMEMEADRMQNLLLAQEQIDSERKVVMEERRQRTENDPGNYFYEQLRAGLFINHPYGNPVIGWMSEIETLDRAHIKDFHDSHYAPNNAILVISGDVTKAEVEPMAAKIFGAIPRKTLPARHWTGVPPLPGLPRLIMHDASVRQPEFLRLYRTPSYTASKEESLALQVLSDILDGGSATRLYKTLVVDDKVATDAGLSYDLDALGDSIVSLSVTPSAGMTMEVVEAKADDVLRAVIRDGVNEQELREAKDRLKDKAVFARDSLTGPAHIFGEALATGSTVDDVEYWPAHIETVTAAQVRDAAAKYLNPDDHGMRPYITGWLLPPEETKKEQEKEKE